MKEKKYTVIKKKLNIEVDKRADSGLASFTHYLQNHKNGVSEYFKPNAFFFETPAIENG